MEEQRTAAGVRATAAVVETFRRASADENPLHVDADYARRTAFGEPVVHGVLAVLLALSGVAPRPDRGVRRISARFQAPVYAEQDYLREVVADGPERAVVRLCEGGRTLLEVVAEFDAAGPPTRTVPSGVGGAVRAAPREAELEDFAPGLSVGAGYTPCWDRVGRLAEELGLAERGLSPMAVGTLAWVSYLVGMEAPGRAALLSDFDVVFTPAPAADVFTTRAKVSEVQQRFRTLRLTGTARATGTRAAVAVRAFHRAEVAPGDVAALVGTLPPGAPLAGRTALVVGASRGLGAAVAQALALAGAEVYAGYHRADAALADVIGRIGAAGARVHPVPGDAADPDWAAGVLRRVRADHGGLDLLVLNACPPPVEMSLQPAASHRSADYVTRALALVREPLAATVAEVAGRAGTVVTVSTAWVAAPRPGWSAYLTAKAAVEGLVRAAAVEHPAAGWLIVRPPRLRTAMTATPLGAGRGAAVEPVAAALARAVVGGVARGEVQVLSFGDDGTVHAPQPPTPRLPDRASPPCPWDVGAAGGHGTPPAAEPGPGGVDGAQRPRRPGPAAVGPPPPAAPATPTVSLPATLSDEGGVPEADPSHTGAPETGPPEAGAPETSASGAGAPGAGAPEAHPPTTRAPGTGPTDARVRETDPPETDPPQAGAPAADPAQDGAPAAGVAETGTPSAGVGGRRSGELAVVATFTLDPVIGPLQEWCDRLVLELTVTPCPYAQVFQQLLSPDSLFASTERGLKAVLLRVQDWPEGRAVRIAEEFADAVRGHARRHPVPLVVLLCPPAPAHADGRGRDRELAAAEDTVVQALDDLSGVHVRRRDRWAAGLVPPGETHYEAARDAAAHIPFSARGCAALAAGLARAAHAALLPPAKVLVLDCDDTLWGGVVGEDGPRGLRLDPVHRAVQDWALARRREGVLLCLASRNADADVMGALTARQDMPLRPAHLTARRVNWEPKAANIASLAGELGLGLDSFVFVDDNPVEVAAVRAACPEVLALRLPADPDAVPGFLDRLWSLDRLTVTDEDRHRPDLYRAHGERDALRRGATSFADFLRELRLSVAVEPATTEQRARLSQLTYRTNQFNLTTVRRSEAELGGLLADPQVHVRSARVADRFGDYGLVGLAVVRRSPDGGAATLDTFLLSCRVLGRGVEHAFLAAVARELGEAGVAELTVPYVPTERNTPVRHFLDQVLGEYAEPGEGGGVVYRAPVPVVADLRFNPEDGHPRPAPEPGGPAAPGPGGSVAPGPAGGEPSKAAARNAARRRFLVELAEAADPLSTVRGAQRPPAPLGDAGAAGAAGAASVATGSLADAREAVCSVVAELLGLSRAEVGPHTPLESLRMPSLAVVDATVRLEERYGRLPPTLFFAHRTLGDVAAALVGGGDGAAPPADAPTEPDPAPAHPAPGDVPRTATRPPAGHGGPGEPVTSGERVTSGKPEGSGASGGPGARPAPEPVAVVGLAGHYPGAGDLDELWRGILDGRCAAGPVPRDRWDHDRLHHPDGGPGRTYSAVGAFLEGVADFDPLYFGITPGDAEQMDPQQRLFLRTAVEAVQDAGYDRHTLGRDVGVYVGAMADDYRTFSSNGAAAGHAPYPYADTYAIANRVSHFLDLTGPSMVVDTACSASGVAVHLACEAVRRGEVAAAIAGGVNLVLHPVRYIQYAQMGMLSRAGACRPFADGADGFVMGEGVGAVLVKPLSRAVADGDHVYGLIRGSAVNSGGRTSGFTVPSPDAQADLVASALRSAGVDPTTVGYVEAHGSGTALGDPIEVAALARAFGGRARPGGCALGSVKANIGHLEPAAGIAGLTKVLLQLRHRTLPPTPHAGTPNPRLRLADSPFRLPTAATAWEPVGTEAGGARPPLRAGVSSFGAGGVNAHLVVESYRAPAAAVRPTPSPERAELFVLSARTEGQLREAAQRLAAHLRGPGRRLHLADVAHTLRVGRAPLEVRAAFTAAGAGELLALLDRVARGTAHTGGGVHTGRLSRGGPLAGLFDGLADGREFLARLATRGEYGALARLWVHGADLDWAELLPTGRRVPLPTYPFENAPYWMAAARFRPTDTVTAKPGGTVGTDGGRATLWTPRWEPSALPAAARSAPGPATVLVIDAAGGAPGDGAPGGHPWRVLRAVDEAPGGHHPADANAAVLRYGDGDAGCALLKRAGVRGPVVVVDRRGLSVTAPVAGGPVAAVAARLPRGLARAVAAGDLPAVTYLQVTAAGRPDPVQAAVAAFGRAVARETTRYRHVRVTVAEGAVPSLAELVAQAGGPETEAHIGHGARQVLRFVPAGLAGAGGGAGPGFRPGGHYLVTGGAGGVGQLVARYLAERYGARLSLVGRSAAGPEHREVCARLRALGGDGWYVPADVTDRAALQTALEAARSRFGALDGVLHAAGLIEDAPLRNKSDASIARVLAPKTVGTVLVDELTAADRPALFVLFSSVAGTVGNAGQSDYAAANGYLDAFARWREQEVAAGRRTGRTVSVAWPLWAEGGMRLDPESAAMAVTALGLVPIGTAEAMRVLEEAVQGRSATLYVSCADGERTRAVLAEAGLGQRPGTGTGQPPGAGSGRPTSGGRPGGSGGLAPARVLPLVLARVAEVAGTTPEHLDGARELGAYGLNSVLLTTLANRLNETFGTRLTPLVFYEFPTAEAIASHLADQHAARPGGAVAAAHGAACAADGGEAAGSGTVDGGRADGGEESTGQADDGGENAGQTDSAAENTGPTTAGQTLCGETGNGHTAAGAAPSRRPAEAGVGGAAAPPGQTFDGAPGGGGGGGQEAHAGQPAASSPREAEPLAAPGLPPSAPRAARTATGAPRAAPQGDADARAIAVVGLACRLPGAPDAATFWRNLLAGRDMVTHVPADRWDWRAHAGDPRRDAGTTDCHRGGFLESVTAFDAAHFSLSPREASLMDPQQRLFLETCWHALEDAGHDPTSFAGSRTGVFAGATLHDYLEVLGAHRTEVSGHTVTGNVHAIVANRVSYLLDLRGPSETVDTACSSSLVALHRALAALRAGECDAALVGGVNVVMTPTWYVSLSRGGMLSPGGRCHTFDSRADGYVRAEGVAAVLLKPLASAIADGDTVRAVVRGSAVGHGGRGHSLTAPTPRGQADTIVAALQDAGVDPATVGYVETHGTGTRLGDPIEVQGLGQAFHSAARRPLRRGGTVLGALKASVGHLESAAGVAGLISAVFALRERTLPPVAGLAELNPYLELDGSPFRVLRAPQAWSARDGLPRRAGTSSFGFGGVNAHVVLEEPPAVPGLPPAAPGPQVVVVSARTRDQLRAYAARLRDFAAAADVHIADLAWTSQRGRAALAERLAVVAHTLPELCERLTTYLAGAEGAGSAGSGGGAGLHRGTAPREAAPPAPVRPADPADAAARWVTGAAVDWSVLHTGARRRIPFPGYPFDHGTRFGPSGVTPRTARGARPRADEAAARPHPDRAGHHGAEHPDEPGCPDAPGGPGVAAPTGHQAGPEPGAADRPAPTRRGTPALLTREWVPTPRPAPSAGPSRPFGVLLVGAADTLGYAEAAVHAAGAAHSGWVLVREHSTLPRFGPDEYDLDLADHAAGQALAQRLFARYERLDTIVDLVDLCGAGEEDRPDGPEHPLSREAARIGLLQQAVRHATASGSELTVVHVTRGRHPLRHATPRSRGAAMAGLVRAVGAEYRAVRSASIDLCPSTTAPAAVLDTVRGELAAVSGEPNEVCLRGTDRYLPGPLRLLPPGPGGERPTLDPHRCYLVSGGTSGLGLAAARRLADLGARRLVLLGRRPLPHRAAWHGLAPGPDDGTEPHVRELVRTVRELADRGVRVEVHTGALTDRETLGAFVRRVRRAWGPVAGVLHCAGSVDRQRPAFIQRSPEAVAATWEPKTVGLRVLDDLVRPDRPDFFVLYSSVSAVLPTLGVGLGDYAAANAYLTAYAQERAAAAGPEGTRYLSVAWGSWSGVGAGEVTAASYRAAGFAALDREEGLDLLERVICERASGVVAAAVYTDRFPPATDAPDTTHSSSVTDAPDATHPPAATDTPGTTAPPSPTDAPDTSHPPSAADAPHTTHPTSPTDAPDTSHPPSAADAPHTTHPPSPTDAPGTTHPPSLTDAPHTISPPPATDALGATHPPAATPRPPRRSTTGPAPGAAHRTADEREEHPMETWDGVGEAAVRAEVEGFLRDLLARELMLPAHTVTADAAFAELGVDSVLIAGVLGRIEEVSGAPLDPSVVLENPTTARLAAFLVDHHAEAVGRWAAGRGTGRPAPQAPSGARPSPAPRAATRDGVPGPRPLAVIGMASRFPGAPDTDAFWRLLVEGRGAIREVPAARWEVAALHAAGGGPGRSVSRWGGFLDGIEDFDPEPFGIAAEDAAHVDPLIRLVLECAEQTFRDAGYARAELAGTRTGVFAAAQTGAYAPRITTPHRGTVTGLNQNFAAAHLAQVYDLRGPHLVLDTACSSSLAALALAEQSLRLAECDLALVAAADLLLDEMPYLKLSASGALSPDAQCRVFDSRANGLVLGEGAGAVLLKPLEAALADGDRVYAVVESVAVNNDGRTMGLTTPNPDAQEEVVRRAQRLAGVAPGSVGYVEAHGTGTAIGDPMELRALTRAFGDADGAREFCGVGSVKSNIGHTLMAAGMAGLHKVILALRHRQLPPTLHCETPNPRFAFARSPFYPNTELRDFVPLGPVRRAGVSAFGFGGVNCHALLREPTAAERAARAGERASLPPAVFHRARHWVERRALPAAPRGHRADPGGPQPSGAFVSVPILPLEELN